MVQHHLQHSKRSTPWQKKLGLRFPYLGNVYNHPYENTVCPVCGVTLIGRQGFSSTILALDGQQCGNCGEKIEIVRHVS